MVILFYFGEIKCTTFQQLASSTPRLECRSYYLNSGEWKRIYDYDEFKSACIRYASVVKSSMQQGGDSQKILETLSCISWHNIRFFNDLIRKVHKQLGSSGKGWKYEEVIAALMISPEDGQIGVLPNIFVPCQHVNQAYFLKLRVLLFLNFSLKANERAHGIPLSRIVCFSQMYGYRGSWAISVIEECVRQRLIECVEIPSDGDDTVKFNIIDGETFRISPLGIIILQEILNEKIYLALLAPELPFHDIESYDKVKSEYSEVLSYMGNNSKCELLKDGVDLVSASQLPKELGRYLSEQYRLENIPVSGANSTSEIRLTEDRLKAFINSITIFKKRIVQNNTNPDQFLLELELDRREDTISSNESDVEYNNEEAYELIKEIIPNKMFNLKIDNSEFIPLVLVALVIRKFLGCESSYGVEVTDAINTYLVDEGNKKEPTNVSRSLRSSKFKGLPWLLIREDLHPKYKKFSLEDNWTFHWLNYFGEEPNI